MALDFPSRATRFVRYAGRMILGEQMLELIGEYQQAVRDRFVGDESGDELFSREPSVIAADFERAILELTSRAVTP